MAAEDIRWTRTLELAVENEKKWYHRRSTQQQEELDEVVRRYKLREEALEQRERQIDREVEERSAQARQQAEEAYDARLKAEEALRVAKEENRQLKLQLEAATGSPTAQKFQQVQRQANTDQQPTLSNSNLRMSMTKKSSLYSASSEGPRHVERWVEQTGSVLPSRRGSDEFSGSTYHLSPSLQPPETSLRSDSQHKEAPLNAGTSRPRPSLSNQEASWSSLVSPSQGVTPQDSSDASRAEIISLGDTDESPMPEVRVYEEFLAPNESKNAGKKTPSGMTDYGTKLPVYLRHPAKGDLDADAFQKQYRKNWDEVLIEIKRMHRGKHLRRWNGWISTKSKQCLHTYVKLTAKRGTERWNDPESHRETCQRCIEKGSYCVILGDGAKSLIVLPRKIVERQ
ncbi:hypothetical protein HDK77DRAFT_486656 [Phyllosticta capitalensis]